MTLRHARNFTLKDVEVRWEKPYSVTWRTGLRVENVQNVLLDGVDVAAAPGSNAPVLALQDVDGVTLLHSRSATVHIAGQKSRKIRLVDTESVVTSEPEVAKDAVERQ